METWRRVVSSGAVRGPEPKGLPMINVQDLRKIYSAQGVKGASSWNRAKFTADIEAAHELALLSEASRESAKQVKPVPARKNVTKPVPARRTSKGCEDCGRKTDKSVHPTLCPPCYDYAGWENTHSDNDHEALADSNDVAELEETKDCPVCRPELDPRTAPKAGKSRAGMVIVAKGTEIHKSNLFKAEAEKAGWTVEIMEQDYEDGDETNTRYFATATRGSESISLAWDGRAYDYHASSAVLKGKNRKIRNLKEALRLI